MQIYVRDAFSAARPTFAMALASVLALAEPARGQETQPPPSAVGDEETAGSVVSYGEDYFGQFPNARTALDLVLRIPAAGRILGDDFDREERRGFSANDDRILINGKRLSGKSNDSRAALGRITVDQVLRIDVIRGSSPDIKVSSQESLINVILREDAVGGSGTFEARAETSHSAWGFGGSASYNGRLGALDYFVSATLDPDENIQDQDDRLFDGDGLLFRRIVETIDTSDPELILASNLIYAFDLDTTVRLNGRYSHEASKQRLDGDVFGEDGAGGLQFDGNSLRRIREDTDAFEIGSDLETGLSDAVTLKVLGLYSKDFRDLTQREDLLIENDMVADDVLSNLDVTTSEVVGRASAVWTQSSGATLELGSEFAVNKLDSEFEFFLRENGELVEQDIDNAVTRVKEVRNESFLIHSWPVTPSFSIESQIFTEYSKITQTGGGTDHSRNFFFLRPAIDARWNLNARDQLQLSLRRDISQLDFVDFASRASEDDEVVGGNVDLRPQKSWIIEATAERTFANNRGRLRIANNYRRIRDVITKIEVAPGVSGVGNASKAWLNEASIEASVRFDILEDADFLIEPRLRHRAGQIVDPIIGQRLRIEDKARIIFNTEFRHDISRYGLSYGGEFNLFLDWFFRDVDEILRNEGRIMMDFFLEKTVFGGLTARFEAQNLFNPNTGRIRTLFEDTRRTGIIDFREFRDLRRGRTFVFALRGNF